MDPERYYAHIWPVCVHTGVQGQTVKQLKWIYFTITVIFFFFTSRWIIPINFNFSWQPLDRQDNRLLFLHFIETDWPRVLLPSTDS